MLRRRLLILAAVTVTCAALVLGAWHTRARARQRALEQAWSEFSQCLIGAPLGPNEDLSKRLRGVRQAGLQPFDPMRNEGAQWPARCATPTSRLHAAIHALGSPHPALLRASPLLSEIAISLRGSGELADPSEIWQDAKEAGLAAKPVNGVPSAPVPLARWAEPRDPVPGYLRVGSRADEVMLDRQICRVATDAGGKSKLDCKPPLGEMHQIAFADSKGDQGLWVFDKIRSTDRLELHGWGSSRSAALAAHRVVDGVRLLDESRLLVLEAPERGPLSLTLLGPGGQAEQIRRTEPHVAATLLGDQVLWVGRGELGQFVFAAQIHTDPLLLEPPRPLLPASWLGTCTGPKSSAIVALDSGGGLKGVAVYVDDEWTAEEVSAEPGARLTCVADGAIVTLLSRAGVLTDLHCTSSGCVKRTVDLGAIPSSEVPVAFPVGERYLVIYPTAFRDYRARLARFEELPSSPEKLLEDDGARGPALESDGRYHARVIAASGTNGTLIAVSSDRVADGFYLFLISEDGSVAPISR